MATPRFTIGEIAQRSGVATSALRFYEERGLITAARTETGQRRYTPDVLRLIAFIRTAQRIGLRLEEIAETLGSLPADRALTKRDWERLSRRWRPRLDHQIALLTALRDQLDECIGCGCLSLRTCALQNPQDTAAALGAGPRYLLGDQPPKAQR